MAKQNHGQTHLHLTNCIHLRNYHMRQHRQSPNPVNLDQHLMRDLALLQRSRSLRDPSTSPPSWFSHSELNANGARPKHGPRSEIGRLSKVVALESIEDLELELADRVGNGLGRKKKRTSKHVRRDRVHTEPVRSNASANSSSQDAFFGKGHGIQLELENDELELSEDSRNVCGIPWNWSRIHNKGKSFISCGLSDSKGSKLDSSDSQIHAHNSNLRALNNLNSCTSSDSNSSPFLIESSANSYLKTRFAGELGIFSNQSFGKDSDLDSEARSGLNYQSKNRHKSLTQKYAPKSFQGIIGQNLVVQALSNTIIKRKIGLIYLFHGSQGTGKSSIARIFAKSLNCTANDRNKPCDSCSSCKSHNLGKNRNLIELGPIESDKIKDSLDNFNLIASVSSQYKVSIFDNIDSLKPDTWTHICKSIENSSRKMVFIFITNNSNINLPHAVLSKSQKFFFPKIKEMEIINYLNNICNNEGLEVDKIALRSIALKSDGSLRDALMIVDQLSLLGQRIDLSTVQELIGVVSEEKLVDLLDLALSGRTGNTVTILREVLETGVDPMALMSQLATLITDILAGCTTPATHSATPHRHRLFFRHNTLGREDAERLRQALRVLSEAEKQLRVSDDKITWLTASLLQLAPDNFYTKSTPASSHTLTPQNPSVVPPQCEIEEEEEDAAERNGSRSERETGLGERNGSRSERETGRGMSLVKGKVSLAQVLNRVEGGWTREKAISIAEKLEKQNLRLESRSRSLLCWNAPRVSQTKIPKLKIKTQQQNSHLSKIVVCARGCLCARENSR